MYILYCITKVEQSDYVEDCAGHILEIKNVIIENDCIYAFHKMFYSCIVVFINLTVTSCVRSGSLSSLRHTQKFRGCISKNSGGCVNTCSCLNHVEKVYSSRISASKDQYCAGDRS